MLTNVSPSAYDYEETLSTLKYADRAKRVRMRVNANVTSGLLATDQSAVDLVPLLQAEVLKLKEMLRIQQAEQVQHRLDPLLQEDVVRKMQARVIELEKQLAERESLIESLELLRLESAGRSDFLSTGLAARSFIKKRSKSGSSRSHPVVVLSDEAIDTTMPRIVNLNQDPLFSECLVYYIPIGTTVAGSDENSANVLIGGPDVLSQHCVIHNDGETLTLEPLYDAAVYLNGERISSSSRALSHLDRIAFGRFHLFRFDAKGRDVNRNTLDTSSRRTDIPGWEFAQEELLRKLNNDSLLQNQRTTSDSLGQKPLLNDTSLFNEREMSFSELRATIPLPSEPSSFHDRHFNRIPESHVESVHRSNLNSQYEEIFTKARLQLESIAQNTALAHSPVSGDRGISSRGNGFFLQPSQHEVVSSASKSIPFKETTASSQWQRVGHGIYAKSEEDSNWQSAGGNAERFRRAGEAGGTGASTFEKEAMELQAELANMQKTLQDRMKRYSMLVQRP